LNGFSTYVTVANDFGEIKQVHLPDGSKVWLNAASTLQYVKAFKKDRQIQLNGEAFFEVKHNPNNPFVVEAGSIQTIVLGTFFNIQAYAAENKTVVSVISGLVKVRNEAKDLAILSPSVQLLFNRKEKSAIKTISDTTAVQAWKRGQLLFTGQTLAEISKALERWYGINIVLQNPEVGSCRYYMSFSNTLSLEELLPILSEVTELQYALERNRNTVTLTGMACN
jgi:transmembrane sensor